MKGLVVFYNMVASVIELVCLQRRNKHICRYSGCCLYSVVYILTSALTMDGFLKLLQACRYRFSTSQNIVSLVGRKQMSQNVANFLLLPEDEVLRGGVWFEI